VAAMAGGGTMSLGWDLVAADLEVAPIEVLDLEATT